MTKADLHWERLGPQAAERLIKAVRILNDAQIPYALAGGWAVYCHVPSTPSVDVDVFVYDDLPEAKAALMTAGLDVGFGRHVELLDPTDTAEIWGIGDEGLGIPEPTFRFSEVLPRPPPPTPLQDLGISVPVVPAAELMVTKVAALHNRDLAYQAHHVASAAMRLGPSLMNSIRGFGDTYWLRKAGKDLFDVAELSASEQASAGCLAILERLGLGYVVQSPTRFHPSVVELGQALAARVGRPDPVAALDKLYTANAAPAGEPS